MKYWHFDGIDTQTTGENVAHFSNLQTIPCRHVC